ncbi:MAG: tryptophan--tRNA ligase [Bdellovibrionales bacterium]|nr:tryptophan--tRNA ligase [Oligoflexia bacterium]
MTPAASKKTVLSAVQPTNQLHLGNYLGAIKNWIPYQDEYECIFFAVDLHSITSGAAKADPEALRENTYRAIATYIACGIDPKKSILFAQSQVPAHAELSWVLTCHSSMGELSRMTQFKDKSSKHGSHIPTGIFVYPVLMAADILLYDTHLVPVGEDQKQHLELARDLAERMNNAYPSTESPAPLFVVPQPMILKEGARIMSLQSPDAKMSKSDPTPGACVFLTDSDKEIEKKFKRAVTDSGAEVKADEQGAGVRNLLQIQSTLLKESYDATLARYVGKQYGYLKIDTANIVIDAVRPIREKTEEILKDRSYLNEILKAGGTAARARAEKVLNEVYKRVGFIRQ